MPEILLILVIALIIFGPRKLRSWGRLWARACAVSQSERDFKRQWEDEVVMERQRIEGASPAPVEHASSPTAETGAEEAKPSGLEDLRTQPATAEVATIAHTRKPSLTNQTDWM